MSGDRPRYLLLVNPSAGGGRAAKLLPQLEGALRARSLDHRLVLTTSLGHGCEEARKAATAGEIPVVMSGDGLIGQIGGVLAGCEVPMGVIPGGRGNDLARVLGIPTEIPAAVDLLAAGPTRAIDVGEVNGRRFLGVASCGFDSEANRIANQARLVKGNLVYLYAALRALAAWKPARFELALDGDPRSFRGYSVAAANSKAFGGGMLIAPDAELDDGKLDVMLAGRASKLRYLAEMPKVFKGTHVDSDHVEFLRGEEIEVSADRPFVIYADGDPIGATPAMMRVERRCLRVIAPS